MPRCDTCRERTGSDRACPYCGGVYCGDHRLPERHDCDMAGTATAVERGDRDAGPEPMDPATVGSAPKEDPPSPPEVETSRDHSLVEKVRAVAGRLF